MSKPLVSVIIPTFNRAHYVCEAVESVLNQTFKDFEIIILDDGSTDQTQELLKSRFGNRIRYYYHSNRGVPASRNMGISKAQGEYVAFLDDDDRWLPEKLKIQMEYLKQHPSIAFLSAECFTIDSDGKRKDYWFKGKSIQSNFDALFTRNFILILTVIVKTAILRDSGGFDERLTASEDYNLWLRLSRKSQFDYLPIPLVEYRVHTNALSQNFMKRMKNYKIIFNKKEIVGSIPFSKKYFRLTQAYMDLAQMAQEKQSFQSAFKIYFKTLLRLPWIGVYYWPEETKKMRFSFFYRLINVYLITWKCFTRSICH